MAGYIVSEKMLPCAILCGGLATRLRPITASIPKSLIAINGEPFISHQLRLLRANDIERVVLCVGYLGEMIRDFVGNGSDFRMHVDYCFDGARPLGTAGAIRKALPILGRSFFVLYGDSYLPCDYRAVANRFEAAGTLGLMTIYRNEGNFDSSNVEAEGDQIVRYDKHNRTPAMQYIDYGLGVFRDSAFNQPGSSQSSDLAAIYQDLLNQDQLASFQVRQRFYEIGSVQGIEDLKAYLAGRALTQEI